MCNTSCLVFGAVNLFSKEIEGKRVLEVGALDVNGSLRSIIESHQPAEYVGVDITEGKGVDRVCDIQNLVKEFGENSFDLIVCTEVLEHIEDWRGAVNNLKGVCKNGGVLLVTTRSKGQRYHGYPYDFWRYEVADFKKIFADFEIEKLEKDPTEPGVFLKAKKPNNFRMRNISKIKLCSIVANRRVKEVKESDYYSPYFLKIKLKVALKQFIQKRAWLRKVFEIMSGLAQP